MADFYCVIYVRSPIVSGIIGGDAVGVRCVDAHMVGTCFEMLYNHLDEFVGRSAPIVVESDIDVDAGCDFAGE